MRHTLRMFWMGLVLAVAVSLVGALWTCQAQDVSVSVSTKVTVNVAAPRRPHIPELEDFPAGRAWLACMESYGVPYRAVMESYHPRCQHPWHTPGTWTSKQDRFDAWAARGSTRSGWMDESGRYARQ